MSKIKLFEKKIVENAALVDEIKAAQAGVPMSATEFKAWLLSAR